MLTLTKSPLATIIYEWLRLLKTQVTYTGVYDAIQKHPNNKDMRSVIDTLRFCNVDSVSVEIDKKNWTDIAKLTTPFMAYITGDKELNIAVVTNLNQSTVSYEHAIDGKKTCSFVDFCKIWTGVAIVAFPSETAQEPKYTQNTWKEHINAATSAIFMACLVYGIYALFQYYESSALWFTTAFTILSSIIGLLLCYIMVGHEWNKENSLAKKICDAAKSNCHSVTTVKQEYFKGLFSWEQLGFLYFGGNLITSLIYMNDLTRVLPLLWAMGLLPFLFTFYSIYYQKFVLKAWCVLCLANVSLFFLQFLVFSYGFSNTNIDYSSVNYLSYLAIMGLVFGGGIPIFMSLNKLYKEHQAFLNFKTFKNNESNIDKVLEKETLVIPTSKIKPIILGSPDAAHTLTIITNTYCSPCRTQHKKATQYLTEAYSDYINIQIIFSCFAEEKDKDYRISLLFIETYLTQGVEAAKNLMEVFYNFDAEYDQWLKAYPQYTNIPISKEANDILIQQQVWLYDEQLNYTPAIFLDGHKLSDLYSIDDLMYFI